MDQEVGPRRNSLPQLLQALTRKAGGDARSQIVGRLALSITAIGLDVLIAPSMYSSRPFLALGTLAVLVLVSSRPEDGRIIARLSALRFALFACSHLLLMLVSSLFATDLGSVSQTYSMTASIISAAKILVVLPTFILLPLSRTFCKRFAPELIASAIVLFVFFPNRYFELVWPWYSKLLTTGAAFVCGAFVPGTYVTNGPGDMIVVGPSVDMVVSFSCSGITGMNLFHLLFGVVTIVEWNRLRKTRALICFFIGSLTYILANFLRLILLFLIGNLVSNKINLDFLGWVIFGITFYLLMKACYDWMVEDGQERTTVPVQARGEAAHNKNPALSHRAS